MDPKSNTNIIGHIAHQWLKQTTQVTVQGHTSGGIFLKLEGERVLFLTNTSSLGPVNIITDQKLPDSWKLHSIINIEFSSQKLHFDHLTYPLIMEPYEIWTIPNSPDYAISITEQNIRLRQAANQLKLIKNGEGFSPFLSLMQGKTNTGIDSQLLGIWTAILGIKTALVTLNEFDFLQNAKLLIGFGRGLTPSGDDFLSGVLFTLNQINNNLFPELWLNKMQQQILEIAREKTNAVSFSLLYCATIGSADFRIQQLLEPLINEDIIFHDQAINIARWGNSSGVDLFIGIAIALQAIQERKILK
ncbi:MAG: oxamate carbamoyltransferase subunit AllH family protein [Anaerolineaceae bacterium]